MIRSEVRFAYTLLTVSMYVPALSYRFVSANQG